MAGEVKTLIENIIKNSTEQEISVEDIMDENENFARTEILATLKQLEIEGSGVLCIGRRGMKTRFIKNAKRIKVNIDPAVMENLKTRLSSMNSGEFVTVDDISKDLFSNNKNIAVEAMKHFEAQGLGVFYIGRRGAKSRFVAGIDRSVVGTTSNISSKTDTPTSTLENAIKQCHQPPPALSDVKFKLVNNVIINALGYDDAYEDLEKLCEDNNIVIANMSDVISKIRTTGFFQL